MIGNVEGLPPALAYHSIPFPLIQIANRLQ
jgi:hypothetical protein